MTFRSRLAVSTAVLATILVLAAAACGEKPRGLANSSPSQAIASYVADQPRTAKARLIQQMTSPPGVVIFGGSRAMRVDPAYIHRRTGLTGFNAAVTQARPEDTWALLNLLHTRFPSARFRFLWVIHADEFGARPLDAAILMNPALARYFPGSLVKAQASQTLSTAGGAGTGVTIDIPKRARLTYAADGYALSGFFSNRTPPPNGHVRAVDVNIRKELSIYGSTPAAFYPRSVRYFRKDLELMDRLGSAPPVLVAAPFDQRIYAATVNHGWGVRHRMLLRLLARLHKTQSFSFLDLSRSRSHGFTPSDFYDGIHLTPQGAQQMIDLVLKRFPGAL